MVSRAETEKEKRVKTEKEKLIGRKEELKQLIKERESKRDSVESISAGKPRIYGTVGTVVGFSLGLLGLNIINSSINHYYPNTTRKDRKGAKQRKS